MRCLLAITLFLAGAMFPPALRCQSLHSSGYTYTISAWARPGASHPQGVRFRPQINPRPRITVLPTFFGYPSNYPFAYFYPGLWPPINDSYQEAWQIAHGDVAGEVAAQQKDYLSSQVQALTDEVRSLRQEQTSREQMPPPAAQAQFPAQASARVQPPAQQEFPATIFIYRDGRELEARDYAILGDALWVFHGQTSRKFRLSDFNLDASRQVNEEHGVQFPVSDQH